ncbi:MAG TPA: hypothetical protein VFT84_04090, partial [Gemmatimonadales bacterium]|nr:hypothetical protein [Gemmatimonadales bacterium]
MLPYGPMPPTFRALLAAAVLLGALAPVRARAQASPYLPLDDPRLPLLEHLIARGDVPDPSPSVRPFRRADAIRVLEAAGGDGAANPLVAELHASLADDPAERRWRVKARAGVQGYTDVRRDPLHPLGGDGTRPYFDATGELIFGDLSVVSRLAAEPRLTDDPEWTGRKDLTLLWRFPEAYLTAQTRYLRVFYGQMDRNWGPVGLPGIGISDYAYPQTELTVELGTDDVRLVALARTLEDERDQAGERVHRYFFAHRLGVRLSDRLRLALWETTVLAGVDRDFDGRYRNPLTLLLLANQYGLGSDGNVLIGLDASWRVAGRTSLEAQLALDDLQYENTAGPDRYPNRWALTLAAGGPLGARLGWRAFYTQASSLAFRTLNPFENFTTSGVGLGRNFADQDQLTLRVGVPGGTRWLLTPELTLLRQGEGRITDPFPATDAEAGALPQIFIGTVERTWRAALDLSGWQGPF